MSANTKFLAVLAVVAAIFGATIVRAAPTFRVERTILPETDSTYELGTSTRAWLRVNSDEICLTGDTCKTAWPTGIGSGTTGQVGYYSASNTLTGTSTIFIDTDRQVGIGTTTPGARLHVYDATSAGNPTLLVEGSTADNLNYPIIQLKGGLSVEDGYYPEVSLGNAGTALNFIGGQSGGKRLWTGFNASYGILFGTYVNSSFSEAFGVINPTTGNWWIGPNDLTQSSTNKLNVVGSINLDQYSSYKQNNVTVLYSSTTNQSLLLGQTGGSPLLTNAGLLRNTGAGYLAFGAGVLTTGAINNSAYGAEALYNLTSGDNNTALGRAAGYNLTTGNTNMFLGASAAFYNQTGIRNVAIGSGALRGNAVVHTSTDSNTAVGFEAGALIGASSDANIFLGQRAGDNLTSGSKNLIIGSDIDLTSSTGSNQLNIGNIIFGTGVSGTGTTIAGSIGIGTTTPSSRLQLFSTATSTMSVDSNSASQGACLEYKDSDGSGYTYVTYNNGVQTVSATSCK